MKHVELSRRAAKDLRQLDKQAARRISDVLRRGLLAEPPPDNLDIKVLQGAEPWLRLRAGTYRILYRPLTPKELRSVLPHVPDADRSEGYLVGRIVHRRDLDQAVATL
jgi:mRNA-degrading endonuclease RelE of RelBE toxin-antitoxin system